MSVPTLFARISSMVMSHSLQSIGSRTPKSASRRQSKAERFTQIVEEMEQRMLLSGTTGLEDDFAPVEETGEDEHQMHISSVYNPALELINNPGPTDTQPVAPFPLADTFALHGKPDADMLIYLDFNGHTTTGTAWNSQVTGGADIVSPAYSLDGDGSTFNDAERERIQRIWQRVVEDFAPFDVDITTEEPALDRLQNTGGADTQWGVRVVIAGDDGAWLGASAGGVAFLNSFSSNIDTPAFGFQDNLGGGQEKAVGEVISHEVGHTLGLSHDGQGSVTYYDGHGAGATGWAPIMGVGYYQEVTQWSSGEYANATETEDDLTIITANNGFGYRADDHGNDINNGTPLNGVPGVLTGGMYNLSGIIEQRNDNDWITFEVGGQTDLTIDVTAFERGPNLDILAELYDNSGNLVGASNPTNELDATISAQVGAGIYHIRVDGVGVRTVDDGYSDYASLGQYTVTAQIVNLVNTTPVILDQNMSVAENRPAGSPVGTVAASDPEGDALAYSIIAGNTTGTFAIDSATGVITVADPTALDFETNPVFVLRVQVSERTITPLSAQADVTISLIDVNDAPVITPGQSFSILEHTGAGIGVGTVIATDEDGDNLIFSIIGGNNGNAFAIDASTGQITIQNPGAVDFEVTPLFNLLIQVGDDGAGTVTSTEVVTITVTNLADLNFVRLSPLGSQVFADQDRQITLTGPGDEAVFDFYGQAGELFSAVITPTDPNAIVTLEIVELNQAFSTTTPGETLVVSGELLPFSQGYSIRITSTVADTLELDVYLNATLEQQAVGGNSSAFTPVAIDDALIDFGVERYAVLGQTETAFDEDHYLIDLTGRVGEKIEIVLAGLVEDFSGATLELQDLGGTTLATASAMPLGADPTNIDLAILNYEVTADGVYRVVLSSPGVAGEYVLTVLADSIGFEVDPNNDSTVALRDLTDLNGVTGYLSNLALNSSSYSKSGQLEKTAALNSSPAAMTAFLPEGVSLEEFIATLGPQSNTNTFAVNPVAITTVGEIEVNDTIAQANQVPLGFDIGEDPNVQITGTIGDASLTVVNINATEDDGDINKATETNIVSGELAVASEFIGDGPFGNSSGDYDFYAVRNVQSGSNILVDIDARDNGSSLDSYIALYDSNGVRVASNDDDFSGGQFTLDSFLEYDVTSTGDYFVAVFGFGGQFIGDPFDSSTGIGNASTGFYDVSIGIDVSTTDVDFFEVDLNDGDIFSAWNTGAGTTLGFYDASGQLLMRSSQNASSINPLVSPLRNNGNAALSWVTDTAGTYYVSITGGAGAYNLNLDVFRPELETQAPGNHQILFLDFDGATVNPGIFGGPVRNATLSGLTSFLPGWGLTGADEDAVIDAIIASVTESLSQDMRVLGNNGDFDTSGIDGEFDIEILNSRDHADPFGQANVSRLIIGGTIGQLGIGTIGIAQSIDVGNFETEETAVILLDLLSADASNPNSLNQYQIAAGASIIDLIGTGVGNIAAHEAGHYFGNWHTNQFNSSPNLMDQGGNLPNTVGVGADLIWGTADDVDVDFGDDFFVPGEGFAGIEDTLNVIAFGLSTGTTIPDLSGPRVVMVTPNAGNTNASISTLDIEFSERLTIPSATLAANFELIEAGADGLFGTADDVSILVTPSFDGDRIVTLTIDPGVAPLQAGRYQLTIDGDQSAIRDLASNALNSRDGVPGSDTIHQFQVAQLGLFPLDVYTVTLGVGDALYLSTSTPLDDPFGTPLNSLDAALLVRDPNGLMADFDENSAIDGRNAELSFIATVAGTYEIEIISRSGEGEYVLDLIINHAPDVADESFAIDENSPVGTVVGTPTALDVDGDTLTYSIIAGDPSNAFVIDAVTGEITVNNSALLDFETMPFFDLIVQVTDDGPEMLTDTAVIRVDLNDINETPTMNDEFFRIDENSAFGTFVGLMNANDEDGLDVLVYTIESGNTNSAFDIDSATGEITVDNTAELDFEVTLQFVLVIRATDVAGLFIEADATIDLNDINDRPVINDQNFQIEENVPAGTSVGIVVASDQDLNPVNQLTFTIIDGNSEGAFAIDSLTGEITVTNPVAINFELYPVFDLQVRVTDDGVPSLSDVGTIHIDLLNLDDGARVPFFDGFESYSVVNPPGTPLPAGSPWVTKSSRLGRAWVTDLYQPFEGKKHLLLDSSVIDNEGSLNEVILEVNPNGAEQLFFEFMEREYLDEDHFMPAVFNGSVDADGVAISSDGHTWYRLVSLTGNTSTNEYQQFSFNLTTFAAEVGIDISTNFFLKLQQFDNFPVESDGIAFDNIRLSNSSLVNYAPVVEDQLIYLNEDPLPGLIVGHVQASDPNAGDALAYEITSGNETGAFSINSMTGVIRVDDPTLIDYETNRVFRLGIKVTDSGMPSLSDTALITIQVKNVEEREALFFDDFESGTLTQWTTSSTNVGRIQVTTANGPANGANHLTFDSSSNEAANSLNEAQFSFNGTNFSEIMLSMNQREFNDEDHPLPAMFTGSVEGDGISLSVDGTNWYRLESLTGPASTQEYQLKQYDLSAFAADNGLNLNQTVYVKIQAYDNFEIPFDGMAFDDVLVDAVPGSLGPVVNNAQGIAGLAIDGGQFNWSVTSLNGGVANGQTESWGSSGAASQGVLEVKTGDFNGDGRDDVALQNNNGEWWIGLSDGTTFNQYRWTHWGATFTNVVVGDFNGDGRDDLLGMTDSGAWWAAEAQGTQFGNRLWGKWNTPSYWQDIQVGDFNGDGLDDIVGRGNAGYWWTGISNGTNFQASVWGKWSSTVNWQDVNVGDFNGDGLADITGRADNGRWFTGVSQGDRFATSAWEKWSSTVNWQDVNVGDFNGDGLTDITGRADSGRWFTGVSQGSRFATSAWGKWSSTVNWNDVVVGDFNGDGKDDVAGRLDDGAWWNSLSQGTNFLNQKGVRWDGSLTWVAVTVGAYNAPAIPVTPPPAAPVFVLSSGTSSTQNSQSSSSLVYQAEESSDDQDRTSGSTDKKSSDSSTESSLQSSDSSVNELFGDQGLLDSLSNF